MQNSSPAPDQVRKEHREEIKRLNKSWQDEVCALLSEFMIMTDTCMCLTAIQTLIQLGFLILLFFFRAAQCADQRIEQTSMFFVVHYVIVRVITLTLLG